MSNCANAPEFPITEWTGDFGHLTGVLRTRGWKKPILMHGQKLRVMGLNRLFPAWRAANDNWRGQ